MTLLPEPDSPTIPNVSPAADGERETVDRLHDAIRRRELDLEVFDLDQRLCHGLLVPHARVEVGVDDVDDQVEDDDGDGAHEDDGHDDRQVRRERGPDDPRADALAS